MAIVIDAGFSMKVPAGDGKTRLDRAIEAARADLLKAGDAPVTVIAAGEQPRLVADASQPSAISAARLGEIEASGVVASSERAIELAAALLPRGRGTVVWYTDRGELPQAVAAAIRPRVKIRAFGSSADNAAIVSLAYEPRDDAASIGLLRVRVARWGAAAGDVQVRLTHDGKNTTELLSFASGSGVSEALFDQVRANGGECVVDLINGGAAVEDDHVAFSLPKSVAIRPRFVGDIPRGLRSAISAVAVAEGSDGLELVVTDRGGEQANQPCIELIHSGSSVRQGIPIASSNSVLTAGLNLEGAVSGGGADLRAVDGTLTPLLKVEDAVVAGISSTRSRLLVSDALFSSGSTVTQRPAFAVLMARACRWLLGSKPSPVVVAYERRRNDPLWLSRGERGADVLAVTGDRANSNLTVTPNISTTQDEHAQFRWSFEPWQVLIAAAIGMLCLEGLLYWRGRVV